MNKYLVAMLVWLLVQTGLATGLKYWTDRRDFMVKSWYVHPVAEAKGDLSGSVSTGRVISDRRPLGCAESGAARR